jgi:REP element-mobilizing transposase RayT
MVSGNWRKQQPCTLSRTNQADTQSYSDSGKHLFYQFPELRTELRKHEFWTNGYYMSTVSAVLEEQETSYFADSASTLSFSIVASFI